MPRQTAGVSTGKPGRMPLLLTLIGIVLLGVSSWYWWQKIYTNPVRVFNGMLHNQLSTGSLTRVVSRTAQGNEIEERIAVTLGGQNRSRTITKVSRGGGNDRAQVVTESIGSLQDDYGRYMAIDTKEVGAGGQPLDFSNILGQWGRSDQAASEQRNSASFFNDALIGTIIFPSGNLSPADRAELLSQIAADKVYEIDYTGVKRGEQDGRATYVYPITVRPRPYIALLQAYTKKLGLGAVDGLEESNYEGAAALKLEVAVDVLSRQLVRITYPKTQQGPGRQEAYTGYGLKQEITLPEQTIPLSELQQRLQNLQ